MDTPELKKERLKLINKNLKSLQEELQSEVYSDVQAYKDNRNYDLGPGITEYDEVFEDDDGYPD